MKIAAYHLGIELTQRCNLDCKHCFRGEMHNVNISREILEKVFDEVKYIHILDLSGGEVFLAYEQLKMLLEIAAKKGTKIDKCSMLINGTVYDQRIYDLLDQYFGNNYQVGISDDDFHEKSIQRIYGENEASLNEIVGNMMLHLENPHSIGFIGLSKHLVENGRALSLNTPKKQFETMGYYYSLYGNRCFVGPMVFIGSDGYISDMNSDIEKRKEQSIGNIISTTLLDSLLNGGIRIECDLERPFAFFQKRETEFTTHQGDHLIFKDNKMAHITYTPDTKYWEAIDRLQEDMIAFKKAEEDGKLDEFFANLDTIYDGDLSQTEHSK